MDNLENLSLSPSIKNLGFDKEKYAELAKNVGRINLMTQSQREEILKRANQELPKEIKGDLRKVVMDMGHDRSVYEIAELEYSMELPKGIFTVALADYLLRNKSLLLDYFKLKK